MAAGRKSTYNTDKLEKIEKLCKEGYTNKEICKKIGIGVATLYEWIHKYPELSEALKRSKEIVDLEVEKALLTKAMGYETSETETITLPDGNIKTRVTTKRIAPDTTACIFWLKNRQPALWRDKQDIDMEMTVDKGLNIIIGDVKLEDIISPKQ